MKVCCLGNTASGKTFLAERMAELLGLPQYSLDQIYWQANWQHLSRTEFLKALAELVHEESWIIDGTFSEFGLESRFKAADKVILLDSHPLDCARRAISRRGKEAERLPEGADDRKMSLLQAIRFLTEILTFNLRDRRQILKISKKYPNKFVLLENWDEEDKFLSKLGRKLDV